MNAPRTPAPFPASTAWSTILLAGDRSSPEWKDRLSKLIRTYWNPVASYLARRWKLSPEDADDLAQEFFARLCEEDLLSEAAPERGRFRTFLQLKLNHLAIDELRRRSAQKRGGGARTIPLDAGRDAGLPDPAWPGPSPADEFDRLWAGHLLSLSLAELEARLKAEGKEAMYQAFLRCAVESPLQSYRQCAEALGLKESDVRNYVFRTRRDLAEIVRRHVRESVLHDRDADDEYAYLVWMLGR